jgi:uncharacterized protein YjbJ (UPF0337 family)
VDDRCPPKKRHGYRCHEVCCLCGGVIPGPQVRGGRSKDQAKGKAKQLEGQDQESWVDAKEKADDSWEEVKDRLDDLGDELVEMMDKIAKHKLGHDDKIDEVFEEADRQREPRVGRPV